MSAITSGNPNAAARPSSGIYTALLTVALVFMAVTIYFIATTTQSRFGYTMPFGDELEAARQAPESIKRSIDSDLNSIKAAESNASTAELDL